MEKRRVGQISVGIQSRWMYLGRMLAVVAIETSHILVRYDSQRPTEGSDTKWMGHEMFALYAHQTHDL